MDNESKYFATRHARPERNKTATDPVSKEYPDITEAGVEQAREKARTEIMELIDRSPSGAIIILAATSDQPRTKQTAEIYGDELSQIQLQNRKEDLIVITKSQIEAMVPESARSVYTAENKKSGAFMAGQIIRLVQEIEKTIKANPDKKIVIDYPLMVNQLAYKFNNRWTDKAGTKTEYFSEVLKKHGNNHEEAGKDWIASDGKLVLSDGRLVEGPRPEQVGKEYLEGLQRLGAFAKQYAGARPVIVGEVGHQWDLDALVTYLGAGKVDKAAFEKVTGGDIAGETEMAEFTVNDNQTLVKYRGQEFKVT